MEQFAYVASHDLQEPLRMIGSYCQLLERKYATTLDLDGKVYIHYAVDGARRMQALIDDLLQYSRVGKKHDPFQLVALAEILDRVTVNLRSLIRKKNAEVSWDEMPSLVIDPLQITQLFQNLINNGIKYCQTKPPRVHISADQISGEWVFRVTDNGIGIASEHRDRIFLIFQRLHTREEYSGTGIGLAICKRIIDNHGGKIWVQNATNEPGSAFCFSVPVRPAATSEKSAVVAYSPEKFGRPAFNFFWGRSPT